MNTQLVQTFDYSQLDAETSALCHRTAQIAETFMQFARRTIDKGIELGEHLIQIKEKLPHGQYMPYLASVGVPYQVAKYWTHKVREQQQLEIVDIYYLPEGEQDEKLDSKLLPEQTQQPYTYATSVDDLQLDIRDIPIEDVPQSDSTEIDVTATVAENERLKREKAELASQLQQSLQQNTTTSTPIRHHGGNGTHKGPPTSEKDGVKRVMRDYTNWQTEAITVPTGFFCNELKSGVLESLEDSNKLIAYMQNDTYHRVLRVEGLKNDRDLIAQEFENLAKKIRAYKM